MNLISTIFIFNNKNKIIYSEIIKEIKELSWVFNNIFDNALNISYFIQFLALLILEYLFFLENDQD